MGGVGSREYESGRAARAQQRARGMGSAGMATTLALDPEHAFGKVRGRARARARARDRDRARARALKPNLTQPYP